MFFRCCKTGWSSQRSPNCPPKSRSVFWTPSRQAARYSNQEAPQKQALAPNKLQTAARKTRREQVGWVWVHRTPRPPSSTPASPFGAPSSPTSGEAAHRNQTKKSNSWKVPWAPPQLAGTIWIEGLCMIALDLEHDQYITP